MSNFNLLVSITMIVALVAIALVSIAPSYPASADNIAIINTELGPVSFVTTVGNIADLTAIGAENIPCGAGGYIFPFGMFSFHITDLPLGQSVTLRLTVPNPMPMGSKYFKCQNGGLVDYSDHAQQLDTYTFNVTLTDGGYGDSDGVANGIIADPSGPGFLFADSPQSSSASVTTTAEPAGISNIAVQSASLSSSSVSQGTPVTVTASVVNRGTADGTSLVKLYVNGNVETSKGVELKQGSQTQLTFTVNKNKTGTYTVYVGNVPAGSFTVGLADSGFILVVSSGALLAGLIGIIFYFRKARAARVPYRTDPNQYR